MTPASDIPAVIFAAGGTGGHIAPMIAVAERLAETGHAAPRVFITSERPIDARVLASSIADGSVTAACPIPARPASLRPKAFAALLASWGTAVRTARGVIKGAGGGRPAIVVTTGGFVAPPAMQAARAERARRVVINLDATPGKAMAWVARSAHCRLDASPGGHAQPLPGWTGVGPLVRRVARPIKPPAEARVALGLDPDRPTLLITGGSQGARTLNAFIIEHIRAHAEVWKQHHWQVLHLAGRGDDEAAALTRIYGSSGVRAIVLEYLDAMGDAWAAATFHVGRAGAGIVAEAAAAGVYSAFLPYPFHSDNHQARNAETLVRAGMAEIWTDHAQTSVNMGRHADTLRTLLAKDWGDAISRPAGTTRGVIDGLDAVCEGLARL